MSTKQGSDEHLFFQRRFRREVFALIHNRNAPSWEWSQGGAFPYFRSVLRPQTQLCGVALSEVDVKRLFDRFYTVENARKSTGLGLSISRKLIEQMNGTISAKYENGKLNICIHLPEVWIGSKNRIQQARLALLNTDEYLRQHRTIASASLRRLFAPLLQFEKREIHTVFLRFPNFELGQKSCLRLLAELRGAALTPPEVESR